MSDYYGILNELNYNGIMRKQASIGKLFPTFPQRVRAVAAKGGVTLIEQLPDRWHFSVPSSTGSGVKYDIYVRFVNLDEMIKKYAPDRRLWNRAGTNVDLRFLASEILNRVDIETDCACPADLYWGGEYIKTQRKAQYGEQEYRPPDIRNPRQYGALCKHGELVFEVLPMYVSTFASFLKRFWNKEIDAAVEGSTREFTGIQRAAGELAQKEEELARGGRRPRPARRPTRRPKPGEEEIPTAEPGEEEEITKAEPVESPELGKEEKPATRTGKKTTKPSTKGTTKRAPGSMRPGTKPISGANNKATRSNLKKGTR